MVFSFDDTVKTVAKLKVVGVGGAGGNAINRMVQSGLQGVEFIAVNTDAMALEHNRADVKIAIGQKLTSGLGAGANPQVGMMSMEEDEDRVRATLEGADMVFIAAGMGGGTGTGAAPVVAQIAREMGILTVAVVTKPFLWEGPVRDKNATMGLDALRKSVDTVIVVPNQKLLSVVNKATPLREAFKMADDILSSATRGISEIILKHGDIQVDFADVRAIMSQGGDALMGTGQASGENRATIAADRAIHSPLLDNISIAGATGVLVNITGGEDLGIMEVNDAMNYIYEAVGTDIHTNIIFGTVINPEMKDEIAITVIATGFGQIHGSKQAGAKGAATLDYNATRAAARPGAVYNQPEIKAPYQAPAREEAPRVVEPPRIELPKEPLFPERPAATPAFSERPAPAYPDRAKPFDDVPPNRMPYGKQAPRQFNNPPASSFNQGARPGEDENRMIFNDAATDAQPRKFPSMGQPQKGRYKDLDPDIDYETPAFLRNQAD
ncbi:MAG TPA: cell division protein FtsZ [Fibrobacteria bacterium]|nr:cell division protein FtsZ [Fibrobacteria bacterium]